MTYQTRLLLPSSPFKSILSRTALTGSLLLAAGAAPAFADAPNVVTTIKPLHSIASAVMEGVGEPHIIIDGAASPHGFALKPSQAFLFQGADVVFWIGPELTTSLAKPIRSMAENAVTVELLEADGISQLPFREGANFDAHDHGDHEGHAHDAHEDHDDHEKHADHDDGHDHEKHADHDDDHGHDHDEEAHAEAQDHDHDHAHEEHAHDDHGHDGHDHEEHAAHDHEHEEHAGHDHDHEAHEDHAGHDHGHDHHGQDPHIWLNPDNGIAIAKAMAATLSKADPDHAAVYQKNAEAFAERIEALEGEIEGTLKPVAGKKFVVFHDAYHHFEHHFGFEASGAITISPETVSSASRVADVQKRIKDLEVTCVFQEPQFDAKLVDVVLEGSDAHKGTLDPLGTELTNGPDLYPQLLGNIAASLNECLSGHS